MVTDWASLLRGWRVYHTHDSRHSAAGFPDLVAVRDGRLVFAELKSDDPRSKPTREQRAWAAELDATECAEVYLWRPADWDTVRQTLA